MAQTAHSDAARSLKTPSREPQSPPSHPREGASQAQEPLFSLVVHELTRSGPSAHVAAEPWAVLPVCHGAPATRKGGRVVLSAVYDQPCRIPAQCRCVLQKEGAPVLTFDFEQGIPSVRPKASAPEADPQPRAWGDHSGASAAEEVFQGYGALSPSLWVQLNPTEDPYVVQLRLAKMPPEAHCKDRESGAYYIYGVARLALHVAQPLSVPQVALKSDRELVLAV